MRIIRSNYVKENDFSMVQVEWCGEFFMRTIVKGSVSWMSDNHRFDELEQQYQKTLRENKLERIINDVN